MLEDTFVKDTMKIYVKELLNKKEIDQKSSIGIKENIDGMEDGELSKLNLKISTFICKYLRFSFK
jgi:hypothetical protein